VYWPTKLRIRTNYIWDLNWELNTDITLTHLIEWRSNKTCLLSFSKDGSELPQNLSKINQDILMFLTKNKANQLSQSKSLEINLLMKKLKFQVKIMLESSEKILNGPTEQDQLQPLMLSISDYLDTIYIILKLTLILLFLELSESTISNPLQENP